MNAAAAHRRAIQPAHVRHASTPARRRRSVRTPSVVSAVVAFVGLIGLGGLGAASPAFALPPLIFEAQAGQCQFSWQDTDPATGIAYGIVEPVAGGAHRCELVLAPQGGGAVLADVTVEQGPGVIYFPAVGVYDDQLQDIDDGSTAIYNVTVTGTPTLPALSSGAATANGCTRSLENRTIVGNQATYASGWNVTTSNGPACATTVTSATTPYVAGAAGNVTEVAFLDPFGIGLAKTVTRAGQPITTASVGDVVVYQFTVSNTGGIPWTITVLDNHAGLGPISCPTSILAAGAQTTCTASYTVTAADAASSPLVNTATVQGTDETRANPTGATVTSAPASASLAITPANSSSGGSTSGGSSSGGSSSGGSSSGGTSGGSSGEASTPTGSAVSGAPSAVAPASQTGESSLAATGANATTSIILGVVGGALLLAGASLLLVLRRRHLAGMSDE